ncbi:hypothetical protein pb186bvf_019513 [Paramecium bursaria]
MLTDDLLERYLVLDKCDSDSFIQLNDLEITESDMNTIRQQCKITQIISDHDANEAMLTYTKLKSNSQTQRWNKEESKLYTWIMVKLFVQQQFSFKDIPKYIWDQVSHYLNKSPLQLEKKWQEYTISSVNHFIPWSREEDNVLNQLVNCHQQFRTKISWSLIGNEFNEQIHVTFRTGKKCRDRWLNVLDTSISKKSWKDQDTQQLLQYVSTFGKKWFKIAGLMQRTENLVKNKYYGLIKKYKTLERSLKITKNKLKYQQQYYHVKEYSESITENLELGLFDMEKKIVILCDWKDYSRFERTACQENFNLTTTGQD